MPREGVQMTTIKVIRRKSKGGPGSGNWGHAGLPGQVGGSAPGDRGYVSSYVPRDFAPGGRFGESAEQRKIRTEAQERAREGRARFIIQRMPAIPRREVYALQKTGKSLADAVDEVFESMSSYDKAFIEKDLAGVTFG